MEPRKWKYNNKRQMGSQKVIVILSIVITYVVFSFFLKSLPVSYAWFSASTSSKGQIVNSTTSDLIKLRTDKILFDKTSKVKVKLLVKNISKVNIPLKVELMLNQQVLDSSTIVLDQNDTFSTDWEEIKEIPLDTNDIEFRIIGFNGYIDELISLGVDQEKLRSTMSSNNDNYQVEMDKRKLSKETSKQ